MTRAKPPFDWTQGSEQSQTKKDAKYKRSYKFETRNPKFETIPNNQNSKQKHHPVHFLAKISVITRNARSLVSCFEH